MDTLDVVLADPSATVLGLDFDGTLSPIVDDPTQAYVHPQSVAALRRIAPHLAKVAIITGRPAHLAIELGGFATGDNLDNLLIMGQYGVERWDPASNEVRAPEPPAAISTVKDALPELCRQAGWPDAWIEDKGRAVAVHTRRLPDPDQALQQLAGPVRRLAESHGLHLEPGKHVLEIRAAGFDKGGAVRELAESLQPTAFVYAGDDLGDIAAFEAVQGLGETGITTQLIFSDAGEPSPLQGMADVVVPGTDGVADWLTRLADALDARTGK